MGKYDEKARQRMREYYLKHREEILASRKEKAEHIRDSRRKHYAKHRETILQKMYAYQEANKEKHLLWMKKGNEKYRQGLKQEVIAAYGGACQCCGETIPEFLSVEHVGQWGAQHRREAGWRAGGPALYKWLKANGFPEDKFGLLCMNCQFATKHGKPCPHQRIDVQTTLSGIAC